MKSILLVCSTKLALKMTQSKQTDENIEKIAFKDYFNDLPNDDERTKIRDLFIVKYKMGYTTFYTKVRENTWTELEFEKLEEITNKIFSR